MSMGTSLPVIADARLPTSYIDAVKALQSCSKLDECQDWADRAEAMASYAKQAGDQRLRKLADRIQARAIRRCGELLKQIEPKHTGRPKNGGGASPNSRKQAIKDAGMSPDQGKTAIRVANIPDDEFEEAVESEFPPSVTALAEAGKKPGFKQATRVIGDLRRQALWCGENDPALVASGLMTTEYEKARQYVAEIDAWMDIFVTNIGSS